MNRPHTRTKSMADKHWILHQADPDRVSGLARKTGLAAAIVKVLLNRGIATEQEIAHFRHPKLAFLQDPGRLPNIARAVERITEAILNKQKICIYGDFDVDGATATALLMNFFDIIQHKVRYYVPDRLEEGYGLNTDAIAALADEGVQLIITVDCGITAVEEIAFAKSRGIDVVVTDHHEPKHTLPDAAALVDPKLSDEEELFKELSGVGVAFKLAWALAKNLSISHRVNREFRQFLQSSLALVALGTIADVLPLVGENRIYVTHGLATLARSELPGIQALVIGSRLDGTDIGTHEVAFRLAPKLNAAGRLGAADMSVELLTTDSFLRAQEIYDQLEKKNLLRQKLQQQILQEARQMIAEMQDFDKHNAIILANDNWHTGVIGIVAGKLASQYWRPTIIIAKNGAEGQGSARSIPGVHIFKLLEECEGKLLNFGGHAQAAGLKVEVAKIESFRTMVMSKIAEIASSTELMPRTYVDDEVRLADITEGFLRQLEELAPFGEGNPEPLFVCHSVKIAGVPRRVGKDGRHLQLYMKQDNVTFKGVSFSMGECMERLCAGGDNVSILFTPFYNVWNGRRTIELRVLDFCTDEV